MKYVAFLTGGIFLMIYLFIFLLLKSPGFQSFIASRAAKIISEELNAPVSIGSVDFTPFFSLELRDVFIGDREKDTIAFIPRLTAFIRDFSYSDKKVEIGTVALYDPVIKVIKDLNGVSRYKFLIDYFGSDTTSTDSSNWNITLKKAEITNASLTYKSHPVVKKAWGMNYRDIGLKGLDLTADDFLSEADTFSLHIHELSVKEKSGLTLEELRAHVRIEPERILFEGLYVQTPHSRIAMNEASFRFTTFDDFDNFEENVRLQASIRPSKIDMKDISYFSEYMRGLDECVLFKGDVKGTISTLRGKNIMISVRNKTRLFCDFSIDGLPDAENAFWHFDFHHFYTSMDELASLPVPPFMEKGKLSVPEEMKKLGNIYYKGKFSGFTTDFVAFGSFKTDIGELGSDVSLKQSDDGQKMNLKGKLWSASIAAGTLFGAEGDVGDAGFALSADGEIFNNGTFNMELKGDVSHIEVMRYNYKNLILNGEVTEKTFDGELHIDDRNIKMDFFGMVDFSEKIPVYDFRCTLKDMYFTKLNLLGKDSIARLSVEMKARLKGNEIDNINGNLNLSGLKYISSKNVITARKIELSSDQVEGEKEIILKSDLCDASVNGNFSFKTVGDAALYFLSDYFPSLQEKTTDLKLLRDLEENQSYVDFDIYTGKLNTVLNDFVGDLQVAENSHIRGHVDFSKRQMEFEASSAKVSQGTNVFDRIEINGEAENRIFSINTLCGNFAQGESFSAKDISLAMNGQTDTAFIELGWDRNDSLSLAGNLSGMVRFFRSEKNRSAVSFEASPSLVWVADSAWYLNEAVVTYADSAVKIEKFVLNHEDQYLYADGSIGRSSDHLALTINNFNLNNLNIFFENQGYTFSGILNGSSEVNGILSSLKLNSDFEIDRFVFNGEDLGRTIFLAQYNSDEERIDVEGTMNRGVIKTASYKGFLTTKGDLDFDVELNKVRLKVIEPFVEGILSEVRGDLGGNLKIKGTTAKPDVSGVIKIQKANFLVDYLQTRYNFTGDILVNKSSFDVNNLRLFDINGNYADVNGKVTHENFSDIKLSLQITPVKFLMLNTKPADNELFYGKAIATGIIDVTGNLDVIDLAINAKTEKDTRFFIPLYGGSEVSENDFISYVSRNQAVLSVEEKKPSVTGLNMDFNLNVTPDAEVQIIFDSKVGDIIRGMGNGNLRMLINPVGDFQLYGDYIIEQGDYLFTLQNIINKKFEIEKGGSIRWNGDPYEAQMDMKAIYKLKTSLFDLTGDSTGRVPVECVLSMKNNLMQPDMSFSINLPESDTKAQGIISNLPQDEINKQIISLLVMNRFVTPENMKGGVAETRTSGNALGVTSSELLSNQLSHWLSQISKDFDIGVNYRPGDEITADELEVALSTQILNDRVIVNGNVGVGGQQHNTSSQLLGDFEVEVKVNKSGKLRLKGFTRSNESIIYDTSPYRQGLGIFYKEDFDSFPVLMKHYWDMIFRRKENTN